MFCNVGFIQRNLTEVPVEERSQRHAVDRIMMISFLSRCFWTELYCSHVQSQSQNSRKWPGSIEEPPLIVLLRVHNFLSFKRLFLILSFVWQFILELPPPHPPPSTISILIFRRSLRHNYTTDFSNNIFIFSDKMGTFPISDSRKLEVSDEKAADPHPTFNTDIDSLDFQCHI